MPDTYKYEEYQGFDKLFYAEVTKDDSTGYTASTPAILAPAGEISVSTERASAVKYYDNKPFLSLNSEGADEINLTVPILPIALLGKLLGKQVDPVTGALIDSGQIATRYFAIGYRLRFTDGTHRYVWRLKGTFRVESEEAKSKDNTPDTNNQELIFTGIATNFEFDMPDSTKAPGKQIVVDERDGLANVTNWFLAVVTPENVTPVTPE